jgi:hypothetical protein
MKKVNVYTSKAGQGKSFVMMIDAIKTASEGKKVAYITAELSVRFVIKRMNHIAKYFGLKGKISKSNLVVFEVPYGKDKFAFDKIEKIKKDFDVLFLDPFEAIRSYNHTPEKPIYTSTQEAYLNLSNLLESEGSTLQSINTTAGCYRALDSNENKVFGFPKELEDKVVLKTFCYKDYFGDKSIIVACDFVNNSVKEYNLTEIMK